MEDRDHHHFSVINKTHSEENTVTDGVAVKMCTSFIKKKKTVRRFCGLSLIRLSFPDSISQRLC